MQVSVYTKIGAGQICLRDLDLWLLIHLGLSNLLSSTKFMFESCAIQLKMAKQSHNV